MGLFHKEPTVEELEDRRDRLVVEEEVSSREAVVEEKRAIVRELRSRYGSGWKQLLGLSGGLDIQSLRSVLVRANRGLVGNQESLRGAGTRFRHMRR